MNHYDWLITKIDSFIRKYYANQLLRGALLFSICILFYFLTISIGEYFMYWNVWVRTLLIAFFVLAGGYTLVKWVVIPLIKMAKLGKTLSHEEAAKIIGTHFSEISDKLLNILQLKNHPYDAASKDLIEASIQQKASQLSLLPISTAVDFRKNKKYLPYLLPLLLVAITILVFTPRVFTEASERLFQPTKVFEKPAPFQFIITSLPLATTRNSDFILTVKTEGTATPQAMYIIAGDEKIAMMKMDKNSFQYTFKNLVESISFKLSASGFYSSSYKLNVLQKPLIKAVKLQIDYPDYTQKKDETLLSLGDLTIPAGTLLKWNIQNAYTKKATIQFGSSAAIVLPISQNSCSYQATFTKDSSYELTFSNHASPTKEKFKYQVKVVPDEYPVIQLQEFRDTVTGNQILLSGTVGDDYGIQKVLFHYQITASNNQTLIAKSVPLKISRGTLTTFQYYFDISLLQLQLGQKLTYFIEAWDNDAIQGSKATKSELMSYHMLQPKQLDSAIQANAQQINAGLSNSAQQAKEIKNDLKELQNKLLQSDRMDWEQQQSLQDLMNKQLELKQQLEQTKKRFEEQVQQSKQKEFSEDLHEKQEDLKKQMDQLLNKEIQEMMKKIEEMMTKLNKENSLQKMKEIEQQNKLFNMDMERMKELMKKLEMQMRMEDLADKTEKLADKQNELKKETDQQKQTNTALQKEQQEIKKQLDQMMKKDMNEMKELSKQMQQKQDLDDIQESGNKAQQNMQESEQQLQQNQSGKSSQQQSKAAENLQQMAKALRSAADGNSMEQIELDIKAVRQLLTNLMRLSFDQETLMENVRITPPTTQKYIDNVREQHRLHQNSYMIRDSLFSLSKRLFKLAPTINKETSELEKNMQLSKEGLEQRRIAEATTRQQYVMMRTNNLALMLNETLANLLQMQSQQMKEGEKQGSCKKPGGKQPKPGAGKQLGDIISQQQDLGNAVQQMKDAIEKRQGKQGQKQGKEQQQGSEGEMGESEQVARMAAQQAALRKQLQDLQSLLNSQGLGNAKELKEIQDKMDKNETDLVNRRMNSEMLLRQKDIITRLLESEKALREQEQDDKRSSKNPTHITQIAPPELQKYLQESSKLLDVYKTAPPQLKPYFREMVNSYYQSIGVSIK
ncbi:MAG TPA: hypothetical protein PLQ78_01205 [Flavipsychrobacter sp.]|nr:hypothetical protein [Flavipsychrobacter sp.]